jgi:cyclic pyranopterin monophosphate synthase
MGVKDSNFTHLKADGKLRMVDVGQKESTRRVALARGRIFAQAETLRKIQEQSLKKGDVFATAHLAGIMGAKQTSNLIPLCHSLALDSVKVEFTLNSDHVLVFATAKTSARTGVEMEALTAVSVACLTLYDMCKAVDKTMVISDICLLKKTGGKSGDFFRESDD